MIDIIIPCYNSHDTIDRCLGSILMQRVLPSLKVTLVNDAGKDYKEVIERYSPLMDICEIGYEENGGPAKARNYGLKNTTQPYVMFMDSDDALATPFSTVLLLNDLCSDPRNVMVISKFIEETAPLTFKPHEKDTSFMHGKMYKRAYLEKYNILQNEQTTSNEDVGFNLLAILIAEKGVERIAISNHTTYYWLYRPESIARKDISAYNNNISFCSFVENFIYVYEELAKRNINREDLMSEKCTSMLKLYKLYMERTPMNPQYREQNFATIKKFYKKIYEPVEQYITKDMFNEAYKDLGFEGNEKSNKKAIKKFLRSMK